MISCDNCGVMHNRIRFCCNECKDKWHNANHTRNLVVPNNTKIATTFCDECGKLHSRKRFCGTKCKNKFYNMKAAFSKQQEANEIALTKATQLIEQWNAEAVGMIQQLLSCTFSAMHRERVSVTVFGAFEKHRGDKTSYFYNAVVWALHRWSAIYQNTPGVTLSRSVEDIVSGNFKEVKEKVVGQILRNPNLFVEDAEKLKKYMFSHTNNDKYLSVETAGLFIF